MTNIDTILDELNISDPEDREQGKEIIEFVEHFGNCLFFTFIAADSRPPAREHMRNEAMDMWRGFAANILTVALKGKD